MIIGICSKMSRPSGLEDFLDLFVFFLYLDQTELPASFPSTDGLMIAEQIWVGILCANSFAQVPTTVDETATGGNLWRWNLQKHSLSVSWP